MSKTTEQDVAFIQALAELLKKSDLTEIEVGRQYGDDDELNVRLSRASAPVAVAPAPQPVVHAAPAATVAVSEPTRTDAAPDGAAATPDLSDALNSPMVGTVYLAPEPGSAPFVSAGDAVQEGQTVLIIEAMKTMNPITAPRSGRVKAVLVENAEPVEFGEPLMIIE